MSKHSKLIGMVVGFGVGWLGTTFGLPDTAAPALTDALMVFVAGGFTYFAPANAA